MSLLAAGAVALGCAAPTGAGAADTPVRRSPPAGSIDAAACETPCAPVQMPPVAVGTDCHWEHVRVPADRFTVLVRRVRVCY